MKPKKKTAKKPTKPKASEPLEPMLKGGAEIRPRVRITSSGKMYLAKHSPLKGKVVRVNPGPTDLEIKNAIRIYEDFHGREVDDAREIEKPDPSTLVLLGPAVQIRYLSNKKNGGGDGTEAIYVHDFEPGNILATDQTRKKLYVLGPKLKVTDRGIMH
jgi:hypothetical protein